VRSAAGLSCATAPTWPEGPKEGSRRPGASRSPRGQPVDGCCADLQSAFAARGTPACTAASLARRAPRALEVVERVLTACGSGNSSRLVRKYNSERVTSAQHCNKWFTWMVRCRPRGNHEQEAHIAYSGRARA
jgi:hypothetical protein